MRIGKQNAHILDTITDAYKATLDLSEQGFTVLNVEIGASRPVVRIVGERICERLKGSHSAIRNTADKRVFTMGTSLKGAHIQWEERR